MESYGLLKISLIISLLGSLILLLIMNFQEPKLMKISDINSDLINKQIKVSGKIISYRNYTNDFTILTLEDDSGKIDAICNCPNLQKNINVTIIGRVDEYNKEIQININKIK